MIMMAMINQSDVNVKRFGDIYFGLQAGDSGDETPGFNRPGSREMAVKQEIRAGLL